MCQRAGARTLTGWQRRGRLPGPPFDVRPSGVDQIQEGEHPAPHLLGRRAIVFGQVRVGEHDQEFADYMNNTPKFVVSKTLQEPLEWNNSTLLKENVVEEIAKLKQQPGKDISITGSGTLVRSLLEDDLLDELRLMVHPIVVGSGKRLFEEGGDQKALELVGSETFSTGVLYLTYQPAHS
jgi:dihydrofolate reductase